MKVRRTSKEVTGAVEYWFRDLRIVWSHHAVKRIKQRLNKSDRDQNIPHRRMYKSAKKRRTEDDCRVSFNVNLGNIRFGCLLIRDTILIRTVVKLYEKRD